MWRSNTPGCRLTNDGVTVQLTVSGGTDSDESSRDSVVCMSDSASVQCGHSVSFQLQHTTTDTTTDTTATAAAAKSLLLSEQDGVGLSVSDNVNVDTDAVVFYSFHGKSLAATL